ncbi:DUF4302 domain-containing protein [Pedobacter paludis]|uniref:DUF4302 domain-containing protein n=1 Tax=Pedobacter paludis TaxID=2203212 RepID=A0A317F0D4_9SPHI|nr:DUF4302 domain-containing protein [Pedobacter paludis]PWS30928.1 hypothetical protein DF947_15100 [Pedobacter paludis]
MKRNYYLILIASCFLFAACDKKKDRIFDESPTDRLNTAVANAQAVLVSKPNGWIMQYYAGDGAQYGGNNFFVNFTSATAVNVQADYTNTNATSTYKVYPGAGPILSFDTYNPIFGMFAAPGAISGYVNYDVGLGGDIEFLVMKATADSVILKSRKRGNRIVMVPMPANPATVISTYKTAFNTYYAPNSYRFETPTGNIALNFYDYMELHSLTDTYSFRVTPTGLDFYQTVTVNGITFKELTLMPATATYPNGYYANVAGTLKLVPIF